ncbi:metal ABC transporter substrate-binding protein [Salinibaculum salinum]|uniref:metal ABC transporter substrate-binding protein n=1 Tax=Salinibaculum salinum TaxID=3131996 RepID=UPI0030EEC42C
MAPTRRQLLSSAVGIAGFGTLAGCLGGNGSGASDATAQATFFVFGDVAANVADGAVETDLLVPVGQHGHGWEPGPRVREDIYDAGVLFHGMDGFQPWVDDIKGDLEDDGADVVTVDVSDGVGLLEAGADHDHTEDDHDNDTHTEEHDDENGHDDDIHTEEHDDENGHDDHGHRDEESADPHFWMDPLRVKEAISNVRRGLAAVDGGNTETYVANADDYAAKLDDLHERMQAVRESASKEVLLIAGHDSFQYFGDRYDIEIKALTDVSPDDNPTTRDIERAQDIIRDHDLQYICADPLESQEAAEQLVAETDAEAVLPLTAMPGLKEEWEENDWGYVDVMEKVNLPTLEDALNAQ